MYTNTHTHRGALLNTYRGKQMYTNTHTHTHTQRCLTQTHTEANRCTPTHTHTNIHSHAHKHMQTDVHPHTRTCPAATLQDQRNFSAAVRGGATLSIPTLERGTFMGARGRGSLVRPAADFSDQEEGYDSPAAHPRGGGSFKPRGAGVLACCSKLCLLHMFGWPAPFIYGVYTVFFAGEITKCLVVYGAYIRGLDNSMFVRYVV